MPTRGSRRLGAGPLLMCWRSREEPVAHYGEMGAPVSCVLRSCQFEWPQSSSPRLQCTRFPLCRMLNFPFFVPLPCFGDSTPLHNIYPSSTYCVTDAADLHMSLLQFGGRPSFNYVKFTLSILTLSNRLLRPRAVSKHSINREQYQQSQQNIVNSINSINKEHYQQYQQWEELTENCINEINRTVSTVLTEKSIIREPHEQC